MEARYPPWPVGSAAIGTSLGKSSRHRRRAASKPCCACSNELAGGPAGLKALGVAVPGHVDDAGHVLWAGAIWTDGWTCRFAGFSRSVTRYRPMSSPRGASREVDRRGEGDKRLRLPRAWDGDWGRPVSQGTDSQLYGALWGALKVAEERLPEAGKGALPNFERRASRCLIRAKRSERSKGDRSPLRQKR